MSVDAFMSSATTPVLTGNTPWAARYSDELRKLVTRAAENAPRSRQAHLGPSELGVACDRQVVGKMAGMSRTNHVVDPWPSIVGTAVHAWLADAFSAANAALANPRWVAEQRVTPHPDHPGTSDLYDAQELAVVDHKVLGPTSMRKVQSPNGPPLHYVIQLLLYALGYLNLGLPVQRVAIAAYPRTLSTLDGLYVWERALSPGDDVILAEVFRRTAIRAQLAEMVKAGQLDINAVPKTPEDDLCYFCPFYRPQAAYDGGSGCSGGRLPKTPTPTPGVGN